MLFGYRVQTSIYGTPIPIVYGRQRVTGNIIQIFAWNPKPLGGKTAGKGAGGGKGGTRQYDYTSGVLIGLCAGPIYGILNVWNDKDQYRLALGTFQWDPADGLTVNISHPPATQAGGAPWPLPPIPGISSGSTGNSFWINNGCTRADTYSQDTNDYGSPGAGTISGTQQTLMQLVRENPQAGQYTLAAPNDVTYGFSPADAGHVITVSFMYEIANTSTTLDPLTHLNLILFNGEQGQAPNPAISTYFPNYALGYSELAYVASDSMDLGSSGMFPNLSFEVYGKCQFGGPGGVSTIPYGGGGGSTVVDCCPADIINDLLSSQLYGPLRWSSADLADPSTSVGLGTAGEVYRYCAANSIFVSQVIDKQQTALVPWGETTS